MTKKRRELRIDLGVCLRELRRHVEEHFAADGEELGRILGGIRIEPRLGAAVELLGEIALATGDTTGAIAEFITALERVRESSWESKEADITARLHIFGALSEEDESYFNQQFAKVLGVG